MLKINDLRPLENNPRKIGQAQMAKLCDSIRRDPQFMTLRPIVYDNDGVIIGGNQRWKACKRLGMTELPEGWAVKASDLTPEQRRRFILVDNGPEGMTGAWDTEALAEQWSTGELDALGFDPKALDMKEDDQTPDPLVNDDAADLLQAKWGTEPGQLWTAGGHRILCGSCTDPANWTRLMQGHKATLCNTDPPYGVGYVGRQGKKWAMIEGDKKTEDDLLATLLVPAFKRMTEHTTPDAAFYIWHPSSARRDFEAAMDNVGLDEKQYIVWVKDNFVLGHADYHWQQEPCFYGAKAGESPRWLGDRSQVTVWRVRPPTPAQMAASIANGIRLSDGAGNGLYIARQAPKAKKTRLIRLAAGESIAVAAEHSTDAWEVGRDPFNERLHPTQKPLRLFAIPIANHTQPGDVIIEPFSGSGSQFVAAQAAGRRCFGMDLDPKYVAVALERLTAEGLTCEREG